MDPKQETPPKEDKAKKNRHPLFLAAIVTLLLGYLAGGYLWNSQVEELKTNSDIANQKLEELKKETEATAPSANTMTDEESTDLSTPTDKDIVEINRFQVEKCSPAIQRDGSITRAELMKNDSFYDGYARVSMACREISESGGAGYVSYMKRQTDGAWGELFGAQGTPGCEMAKKYGIPEKVLGKCI